MTERREAVQSACATTQQYNHCWTAIRQLLLQGPGEGISHLVEELHRLLKLSLRLKVRGALNHERRGGSESESEVGGQSRGESKKWEKVGRHSERRRGMNVMHFQEMNVALCIAVRRCEVMSPHELSVQAVGPREPYRVVEAPSIRIEVDRLQCSAV